MLHGTAQQGALKWYLLVLLLYKSTVQRPVDSQLPVTLLSIHMYPFDNFLLLLL